MVDWARFGADMEQLATRTVMGAKRLQGALRPTVIQPYRGFVVDGVAHVRARVVEQPRFETAAEGLRIDATLAANLLRWVVLDLPDVEVTVSVGAGTVTATSDENGFVIAKVPVGDIEPGWHAVSFAAEDADGEEVAAYGRVVLPDPASRVAVISDIDDTLLNTGITEGLTSIRRTLFRDAHGRKPVAGTPSLYRGLARGTGGRPESTFFYVSKSPWNLYDMLVQFLQLRGFPRGPLFLTDWRPGPAEVAVGQQAKENPGHKRARIRRLLDAYPELSFVLLGDSGESDPEIFEEFVSSDPDRVAAALIRNVNPESKRSYELRERELARRLEGENETIVCDDSVEMAEVAHFLGLVDELTVEEVQTELTGRF